MNIIKANLINHLPIQYKELTEADFEDFDVVGEHQIPINAAGYIDESWFENLRTSINEKETVVVNAGVGQGKTTAIKGIIHRYYGTSQLDTNDDTYVQVIAAPFRSLIGQYEEALIGIGISKEEIFNYEDLDFTADDEKLSKFCDRPIHIITINSLMGNPGDEFLRQSKVKRKYTTQLIEACKEKNAKVIWYLDELHASISNFKPEHIFKLRKWDDILLKTFVISATYTEASKVVIKYLAEQTERNIRIFESPRFQVESKLSKLHFHFIDEFTYKIEDDRFDELFRYCAENHSVVNIFSYSKTLAEKIYESDYFKNDKSRLGEKNLCTSETGSTYEEGKLNIGTNFGTGVSIESENSAFIIIMPAKAADSSLSSVGYGVFYSGITSVIQAIARVRKPSTIYVVQPMPNCIIGLPKEYSDYPDYNKKYISNISSTEESFEKEQYVELSDQGKLFEKFYLEEKDYVSNEIARVDQSDRTGLPFLEFPSLDDYKLLNSEKFLVQSRHVFGKSLANYTYWAAINNQFVNAKLHSISLPSVRGVSEDTLIWDLDPIHNEFRSISEQFESIRSMFIGFLKYLSSTPILFGKLSKKRDSIESDGVSWKLIKNKGLGQLAKHLLSYYQVSYGVNVFAENEAILEDDVLMDKPFEIDLGDGAIRVYPMSKNSPPVYFTMTKSQYIWAAMSHCVKVGDQTNHFDDDTTSLIKAYQDLFELKKLILEKYSETSKKGNVYLPVYSDFEAIVEKELKDRIEETIHSLKLNDLLLSIFSFLDNGIELKKCYRELLGLFFEHTEANYNGAKWRQIRKADELVDTNKWVNFIF